MRPWILRLELEHYFKIANKKSALKPVFCCPSKTISRILCYVIIYLFATLLSESSELLFTESQDVFNPIFCFVLAPNKDLAVSVPHYCRNIPLLECQIFRSEPFLFAPLSCDRWPLATTFLTPLARALVFGLSSLSLRLKQSLVLLRHLNNTKFLAHLSSSFKNDKKIVRLTILSSENG